MLTETHHEEMHRIHNAEQVALQDGAAEVQRLQQESSEERSVKMTAWMAEVAEVMANAREADNRCATYAAQNTVLEKKRLEQALI